MHEHAEAGEDDVERVGEQQQQARRDCREDELNPMDAAIWLNAASTATEA